MSVHVSELAGGPWPLRSRAQGDAVERAEGAATTMGHLCTMSTSVSISISISSYLYLHLHLQMPVPIPVSTFMSTPRACSNPSNTMRDFWHTEVRKESQKMRTATAFLHQQASSPYLGYFAVGLTSIFLNYCGCWHFRRVFNMLFGVPLS